MADEKQKTVAQQTEQNAAPKEPKKMSIPKEVRARYTKADAKTPSKGKVLDNADAIAVALRAVAEKGVDALISIANENGTEVAQRVEGYISKGLNNGQIRMNTGNILRGLFKNGHIVYINGQKFHDTQAEADRKEKEAKKKEQNAKRLAELNAKKSESKGDPKAPAKKGK